uniref:Uncharacterized protein n=1 Tax=Anguilla anguilla TaxID=7936 RepID=A0A0E9VYC0_ANGAN
MLSNGSGLSFSLYLNPAWTSRPYKGCPSLAPICTTRQHEN